MSDVNRCDGWAQCTKCPRPGQLTPVPPGAEKARCAPRPVRSCPITGAHCPPTKICCSKIPGCPLDYDCKEFIPYKCSPMPAINCTPNIPPSGWSVLGWKPSPAAYRCCPQTQMPSSPCRAGKTAAAPVHRLQKGCCDGRCLEVKPRPLIIRHVRERPPLPPFKPFPCVPTPAVRNFMTCSSLGTERFAGRVNHKFTFSGFRDTPAGRFVTCKPAISCFQRVGYHNSALYPKGRTFQTADVPPSDQ